MIAFKRNMYYSWCSTCAIDVVEVVYLLNCWRLLMFNPQSPLGSVSSLRPSLKKPDFIILKIVFGGVWLILVQEEDCIT